MKSCCLDVSVDGVKAYQRDCIRYADVVRTAFERGVWGLRPNLAIFLSEDGGFSDYIRLLSPMVLNQRYSKTISFVLMSLVHF